MMNRSVGRIVFLPVESPAGFAGLTSEGRRVNEIEGAAQIVAHRSGGQSRWRQPAMASLGFVTSLFPSLRSSAISAVILFRSTAERRVAVMHSTTIGRVHSLTPP